MGTGPGLVKGGGIEPGWVRSPAHRNRTRACQGRRNRAELGPLPRTQEPDPGLSREEESSRAGSAPPHTGTGPGLVKGGGIAPGCKNRLIMGSQSPSILEIKEETRLILGAFLQKSLTLDPSSRPGHVGRYYRDPQKYRHTGSEGSWNSIHEAINLAEEKKHKFKTTIKKRFSGKKKNSTPSQKNQSQASEGSGGGPNPLLACMGVRTRPSSQEEEEEEEGEGRKRRSHGHKKPSPFLKLFKRKSKLEKAGSVREGEEPDARAPPPPRPDWLPIGTEAESSPPKSPGHTPQFYSDVADTLERIARQHTLSGPENKQAERRQPGQRGSEKEVLVSRLVALLSAQGDAINEKVKLRDSSVCSDNLSERLKLCTLKVVLLPLPRLADSFASSAQVTPSLPGSPTLSRIALTMDLSRRIATVTGAQRLMGYTEQYMEAFAPWIRENGGWENIVQLNDLIEVLD
ncbi:apoptosis facilitator Bcl-2-like protein 14 [Polyodon spathula]|uniref:apoptosis facilitator Bcl-2-like protein 14 n=1 Tax=Polyodon spathula TaxID=7913 RepID=UPI001B7F4420|nr:apoptosis facilitator Bcl-2-like protein 14 [Polyodon spathula]